MHSASPRPLRIALAIHSLFGGGAERLMSQLAARWAAAGHEIHLVTWSTSETDQYSVPSEVQRHGLDLLGESSSVWRALWANVGRVRTLRRTLRQIQPDLVLSFCDQMNVVALQAAGKLSIPVVICEHSNPAKQRLSRVWEAWRSRTYPRCRSCVVLTDEIADYMQRWIASERLLVIPAAVEPPTAAPAVLRSESTVLAVGRLSHEKGFDLLIEAWRQVHPRLPGWQLCIAGVGSQQQALAERARDLPTVQLLGWIQNTWPLYQQATLFVLPSRYEGFPIALIEALSQGCPAIATRCTAATECPPLSASLHLVDIESVEQLAEAIEQVAKNPVRRAQLAASGVRASEDFHWQKIGNLWDRLLIEQPRVSGC
jgi:GalNAc-alpha-(1->4)-GalNAc-alpha-(1->3)-diNAcBac-PP-undecaprenol alpha-1,4-N-acetyl-D-galactosaminyltransferase